MAIRVNSIQYEKKWQDKTISMVIQWVEEMPAEYLMLTDNRLGVYDDVISSTQLVATLVV